MKNYQAVNDNIRARTPCTSFEPNTYFTKDILEKFCENRDYKYVAIYGVYKPKYKWTDEEAAEMYAKSPDGWTDAEGVYRLFDWGKGNNKVINGPSKEWHEPHLDHIVPREECDRLKWSEQQKNSPKNMQVLSSILNRFKTSLTNESAKALVPLIPSLFESLRK